MTSYKALMVDVEDVDLIYKTARATAIEEPEDVNYLLGVIEGTLGKYFVEEKKDESKA